MGKEGSPRQFSWWLLTKRAYWAQAVEAPLEGMIQGPLDRDQEGPGSAAAVQRFLTLHHEPGLSQILKGAM